MLFTGANRENHCARVKEVFKKILFLIKINAF